MSWQWWFFTVVVRPLMLLFIGVNVFGRQHLPMRTPFILVANHNSHLDTLVLLSLFPQRLRQHIRPVAAGDYFLQNPVLSWLGRHCIRILPIPRSGITRENNPIQLMGDVLEAGDALLLFPEGTRGDPEVLAPFKAGIAHLLARYPDVPVVPVFLKGMGRALPKGEVILLPLFCDVVIGPPRQYQGSRAEVLERILADILALAVEIPSLHEAPAD